MSNRIWVVLVFCALVASASAQDSAHSGFDRFNFKVGGGLGIGRSYVAAFVGNSYHGVAGGGINFNRMFGVDAEYMYYDLSIRPSVANSPANLHGTSGDLQAVSVNGIVNAPLHSRLGAYGIFGIGFYRRSVSANSQSLLPGTTCQPIWTRWMGVNCPSGAIQAQQTLSSFSKDAGGFNFGGGVSYRLNHLEHAKVFVEARYHRAYQSDAQTTMIPITVGLRW